MNTQVKIKGVWLDYSYCIDDNHSKDITANIDPHMEAQEKPVAYIGKSNIIKDNDGGEVKLKRISLFFKSIKI